MVDTKQYAQDWNNLVSEVKAVKSATNPHFKNKFAPLDTWLDEVHRLCKTYGFMFTERVRVDVNNDDIYQIHIAEITHIESGLAHNSEYFVSLIDKPQSMGGALTYARRYNIQCLLTCTGEDDDDAQSVNNTVNTTTVSMTRKKIA